MNANFCGLNCIKGAPQNGTPNDKENSTAHGSDSHESSRVLGETGELILACRFLVADARTTTSRANASRQIDRTTTLRTVSSQPSPPFPFPFPMIYEPRIIQYPAKNLIMRAGPKFSSHRLSPFLEREAPRYDFQRDNTGKPWVRLFSDPIVSHGRRSCACSTGPVELCVIRERE